MITNALLRLALVVATSNFAAVATVQDAEAMCEFGDVRTTVEATRVAACLESGFLVDLEAVRVVGLLDLSGTDAVERPFRCRGCEFAGAVNVRDVSFSSMLDLTGSTFEAHFDARAAVFNGAFLAGPLDDASAIFQQGADFSFASFSNPAVFEQAGFSGETRFDHSIWTRQARFIQAAFAGDSSFDNATFSSGAVFRGAHFTSGTSFQRASGARIDFTGARIECSAQFAFLSSASTVTFEGAVFVKPPQTEAAIAASECGEDEVFRSFSDVVAGDFRLDLAVVRDIGSENVQAAVLKLVQTGALARGDLSVANDATAQLRNLQTDGVADLIYRWVLGYLVKPLYPMVSFLIVFVSVAVWQRRRGRAASGGATTGRVHEPRPGEGASRFALRRAAALAFTRKKDDEVRVPSEHVWAWALRGLIAVAVIAVGNSTEVGRELIEAVF